MQATIAATSSHLDNDTVLIEVTTTIGESVSTTRCGYSVFELQESRYMAGTLEERIEKLRVEAQNMAEHSFRAQYATLLAYQMEQAPVAAQDFSQAGVSATQELAEKVEQALEEPVKKTRKARTATKPATEQE